MEVTKVEQRKEFAELVLREGVAMAEACRKHGISRQTGYKWLRRYEAQGIDGLSDASRAPKSIPHRTSETIEEMVVWLREKYPTFGPKKLRALLLRKDPVGDWPAVSTIGQILERKGLVVSRERRRRTPPYTRPLAHAHEPNDVWSIDFKGQFHLGNGALCYPLTVTDNASRMLLGCWALTSTETRPVRACMEELFTSQGLPIAIRSDNGAPFASTGILGLSALSAWWLSLGVSHERIEVGHPEQNGRHERMHLTLKRETTRPAAADLEGQQQRFDTFRRYYNEERPHEGIGQVSPATVWSPSARTYPSGVRPLDYTRCDLVKRVSTTGSIKFGPAQIHVSQALAGLPVGLTELDEDVWMVTYATLDLGLIETGETTIAALNRGRGTGGLQDERVADEQASPGA